MTDQTPKVLLIGAGNMAIAYAKVLQAMGIVPTVFGRGTVSAKAFQDATRIPVITGTLAEQLANLAQPVADYHTIVTVNTQHLAAVTQTVIAHGGTRILVEKPAALDVAETDQLLAAATAAQAMVYVAYNRRFLSSVIAADRMIAEDGGVVSLRFDFSEPSRRIATLKNPTREFETWFYGNSTHVIDLAFYLFGTPVSLNAHVSGAGRVPWHPQSSVFAGFGTGQDGATLAWHSNWAAPGRWGLEVMTAERKLILQPLEKLRVQTHDGFAETEVDLEDQDAGHAGLKPGVWGQTRAFLFTEQAARLISLQDHAARMDCFECIRTGGHY